MLQQLQLPLQQLQLQAHPTPRLFGAAPTRTVLALLFLLRTTSSNHVAVVLSFQPRPAVSSLASHHQYPRGLPTRTLPVPSSVVFSSVQPDAAADEAAASSLPQHPYEYDLAVIGGGPVGVQAAIAAASLKNTGQHHTNKVVLIDAPRASGALMNEDTQEDLSLGGPTGLFSKALRVRRHVQKTLLPSITILLVHICCLLQQILLFPQCFFIFNIHFFLEGYWETDSSLNVARNGVAGR